ncbi:MAG: hypothetical protein EHM17_05405 [Verrucomicrobiaceae bacterium]|nr:MAG: hypothetical protein EHM17_05405 [Verrucomicrobiaceae bacterium]
MNPIKPQDGYFHVPHSFPHRPSARPATACGGQDHADQGREAGNRCELVVREGGGHGYMLPKNDPVLFDEAMRRTEEFLKSLGWENP